MRRSVVTAVVLGTVSVGALTFVGGCSSRATSSVGGVDIAEAFHVIESHIEYSNGYAELDDCPLGDVSALARIADGLVELPRGVADGELTAEAFVAEPDYPALVQCFVALPADGALTAEDPQSFGVSVSGLPVGSYRDFLLELAFDEGVTVVVDHSMQRDDGDVFGYCYTGDQVGCAADWVDRDNGVAVSVYLDGARRTSTECIDVLDAVFDEMTRSLVDYSKTTPWASGSSLE